MEFRKVIGIIGVAVLLVVLIVACAATTTSMTSVSDQNYKGAKFRNLLVSCPVDDLEERSSAEGVFAYQFRAKGITAYRAMDVFPPLRDYTVAEIRDSLLAMDIHVILVVAITDYWQTTREILGRTVSTTNEVSTTSGTVDPSGFGSLLRLDMRQETTSETTTRHIPGITLSQKNVRLDVRMFAVEKGNLNQLAWRGNSTTVGNYFAGGSKVMRDAATKTLYDLQANGILWRKPGSSYRQGKGKRKIIGMDVFGKPIRVEPPDSTEGDG